MNVLLRWLLNMIARHLETKGVMLHIFLYLNQCLETNINRLVTFFSCFML